VKRWHHQLRWKLFISHLVIIVVAMVVLLVVANFLAGTGLGQDVPLTLGTAAAETGQIDPAPVMDQSARRRFQTVVDQALLIASFAALGTAVIVSLFVSRRIVEPIQAISTVSRRLAQGFYRERTLIASEDELADLSRSVNQLAATLEQTEQRRLDLLADVAHELRTPLATIEGYMEGLLDGVIDPGKQTFTLLLHESVRLQRLIEDLELLSRVEAGQLPITPQRLDLAAALAMLADQFQPQFAAKGVALRYDLPPGLPEAWVDADRIEQVFINLLANALRYTPAGGAVTLSAALCEVGGRPGELGDQGISSEIGAVVAANEYLLLEVRDSGIGIAPEHLPHLFERFYRVDKSRARASGGSGIGLTVARYLVYAHGGEIWAESPGSDRGTTVRLTLPVVALQTVSAEQVAVTAVSV
jgi:histidine kinase